MPTYITMAKGLLTCHAMIEANRAKKKKSRLIMTALALGAGHLRLKLLWGCRSGICRGKLNCPAAA